MIGSQFTTHAVIARPHSLVSARPKAVAIHDFMPAWIATQRLQ